MNHDANPCDAHDDVVLIADLSAESDEPRAELTKTLTAAEMIKIMIHEE